jgi:hypothetical protein
MDMRRESLIQAIGMTEQEAAEYSTDFLFQTYVELHEFHKTTDDAIEQMLEVSYFKTLE